MSPVVAVPGGRGNLGRTIVEAILDDGKFTPIILAREVGWPQSLDCGGEADMPLQEDAALSEKIGARIVAIDYSNVQALTKLLEDEKVEVVISTLNLVTGADPELSLIKAAEASRVTKRYIPAIWGIKFGQEIIDIFPPAKFKTDVIDAVTASNLEYSIWIPGYFLDWFTYPGVKTYMQPFPIVVDFAHNTAAIPIRGDIPVALTHTVDMAKLVAKALTLSKWEPETYCIAEKITWDQMIAIGEKVKKTKFKVTYDTLDTLKTHTVTELPGHPEAYKFIPKPLLQSILATFGIMFGTGAFDLKYDHSIQDVFPEVKVRKIEELLTEAWKTD
ncbi:hypothetical protein LZL87_012817 [Fusarium oxysporum]|nr:hypothetical protein LZL87_012817 [Fusarium oxysporum]